MKWTKMNQIELKKLLNYDPNNGVFTWLTCQQPEKIIGDEAGRIDVTGYRLINLNKIPYMSHRLAFMYMTGSFPKEITDHINHNRSDNRWAADSFNEKFRKQNK